MGGRFELLKANIYEISKSGALKTLGGLLALFHVLQFYFWSIEGRLPLKLVAQGTPMCWSLMESCAWMHLPLGLLTVFYYLYAVLAILAAATFIATNWVGLGCHLLLVAWLLSMSLYFQDLRLSNNSGYFILFLTFAYLFVPSKHRLMRRLIVSFFVARGLSQCASDWLTGSWYMDHLHLPIKLAEWFAAMSVLSHMIGGAAILFRDARYFWSGWLSLFLFECANLYMGEILPSCLALGALVYVALDELELRKAERQYIYQSFIRPEPSFFRAGLLLTLFWSAQVAPLVAWPKGLGGGLKSVLSIWAVHTEASHEDCEQKTWAIYKSRTEKSRTEELETEVQGKVNRQPAIRCNPYLRYLDLKAECKKLKQSNGDFVTISSSLQIRDFREKSLRRAFEVEDFCHPEMTFKRVGEVPWTTNPAK